MEKWITWPKAILDRGEPCGYRDIVISDFTNSTWRVRHRQLVTGLQTHATDVFNCFDSFTGHLSHWTPSQEAPYPRHDLLCTVPVYRGENHFLFDILSMSKQSSAPLLKRYSYHQLDPLSYFYLRGTGYLKTLDADVTHIVYPDSKSDHTRYVLEYHFDAHMFQLVLGYTLAIKV